jgi:hemoglobin/transferrin/lactoferrin receptor protein
MALDHTPATHPVLDVDPVQTLEGYQVLNLFAEYYPPTLPGVTLRGEIRNVFDESYADRATYGGDYPGFSTLKEPGRTFVVEAVAPF